MSSFGSSARALLDVVTTPVWFGVGLVYSAFLSRKDNPWVISGHRGRLIADNPKSLFEYVLNNTDQELLWVLNENQFGSQRTSKNLVKRHSFSARISIIRAPVLIYSHGEDDIDIILRFLRPVSGERIYIGHGANLFKRHELIVAGHRLRGIWKSIVQGWAGLSYDYLLTMSPKEKANWDSVFPERAQTHLPYGGAARVDNLRAASAHQTKRVIAWLPTFRDSHKAEEHLQRQIAGVTNDARLLQWLDENDYTFFVGNHINSPIHITASNRANPRLRHASVDEWIDVLAVAELLISDYSSILIDWLPFDRPAVFAPFDLRHYSTVRGFHKAYDHYVYGPLASTPDELVRIICSESWRGSAEHEKRRTSLHQEIFGCVAQNQAALTYETIKKITQHQ